MVEVVRLDGLFDLGPFIARQVGQGHVGTLVHIGQVDAGNRLGQAPEDRDSSL
jgi:hypothetical protein